MLFNAKVAIWNTNNMAAPHDRRSGSIRGVKANFLKRTLGASKFTPARLVYELAKEPFFLEELRIRLQLPTTSTWGKHINDRKKKRSSIWEEFYCTEAMMNRKWMLANYTLRHMVTRSAVHGFHHRICATKAFHTSNENCICELFDKNCDRYHLLYCSRRTKSLV